MSINELVEEYCTMLRRRQISGALPCAKRTAEIMRDLITRQRHPDAASLIDDVQAVGNRIQAAKPLELTIGNMVRRVLHIIREEAAQERSGGEQHEQGAAAEAALNQSPAIAPSNRPQASLLSAELRGSMRAVAALRPGSLSTLLDAGKEDLDALWVIEDSGGREGSQRGPKGAGALSLLTSQGSGSLVDNDSDSMISGKSSTAAGSRRRGAAPQWAAKHNVIDAINELIEELGNIRASIMEQGVEHIHSNEVLLTLGLSDTVFYFLREASKKRGFQVVVAEGAPKYDGHDMARQLAAAGVQTTLIADSCVFAMMARANKVLVGAHAVLANGGVIAPVGTHMVALAARRHAIPLVVLVGLHKLSPLFPHDPDLAFNEFKSPSEIVDFDLLAEAFSQQQARAAAPLGSNPLPPSPALSVESAVGSVLVPNPAFDYLPPTLISLFLTDTGGYTPSYVYRLLTEYYSREDYMLSKDLHFSGR